MKELTEEQKVKLTAKKEKLRERRRETKLRKRVEKENENPEKYKAYPGLVLLILIFLPGLLRMEMIRNPL